MTHELWSTQGVKEPFTNRFHRPSETVWKAPGRVNVIGDHTDYQGGFALAIAVPYSTWIAAARREDGIVRAVSDYENTQIVMTASQREQMIEGPRPLSGLAGFLTAIWDLMEVSDGADLWIGTTLPVASGLSSSAALCLGLLATVSHWQAPSVSAYSLATLAQQVENRYLGVQTGILDPLAIALAQDGSALWVNAAQTEGHSVAFDYARGDQRLWIVDTQSPRILAGGGYQQRVRETQAACAELGVDMLSEAALEDVERLADPILRSRSYHVLTENQRVLDTIEAASQGHWDRVRTLFWESHASLSRDYAVSTPRLDATVACLQTLHIGARLTGAGFGGAVIALGPADQTEEMEDALGRLYRQEGWGTPAFLPVPMPVRGLERVG